MTTTLREAIATYYRWNQTEGHSKVTLAHKKAVLGVFQRWLEAKTPHPQPENDLLAALSRRRA